jgi:DNA-binding MarR family transcriptional regulator
VQIADSIDDQVAVARAMEGLIDWLRQARDLSGVSASASSVLSRLRAGGPARVTDLAAREGLTQPGMTTLINRLEKEGLATRASDPLDGRAVLVAITDAGTRIVHEREADRAALVAAGLNRLTADERAALSAALPALAHLTAAPAASLTKKEAPSS